MKTVESYVSSLAPEIAQDELVRDAIEGLAEIRIDEKRAALARELSHGTRKPYLHALESKKLRETTYDAIMNELREMEPKIGSLYLHIPFCTKRCSYCHYYKEVNVAAPTIEAFPAYIAKELSLILSKMGRERLRASTIHYGGGTPSLLTIAQWKDLLARINDLIALDPDDEVAIECDPEDIDPAKMEYLRSAGMNRISLGVQSFDDDVLKLLKRDHDGAMARSSHKACRDAGFENVNIDLMYGMPGRPLETWLADLREVIAMRPESVTIYATRPDPTDSIEKFSAFPGDEERIFVHYLTYRAMMKLGYIQFSPNQFIRTQMGACIAKQNRNQCHDILGVGPLAHSIIRQWFYHNKANLTAYLADLDQGRLSLLKGGRMSPDDERIRFVQFGLKLSGTNKESANNGVIRKNYAARFGDDIEAMFSGVFSALEEMGVLVRSEENVRLTVEGALLNREVLKYVSVPTRRAESAASEARV